jgi:enterochelin esterase-like enzyme
VPGEPAAAAVAGASADEAGLTFRFADARRELAGVRLLQEVGIPGARLEFRRAGGRWELALERPPVSRLEYLLELRYPGGGIKVVTDPANPRQVPGAFGPKNVLEFPGYAPPGWLSARADPGRARAFELPALDGAITVRIWSPAGAGDSEPLPLLVVHDGPEYDALAAITRYLGAGTGGGWLPRLRAALLSPGHRDSWYSASARYARVLGGTVLPAIAGQVRCTAVIGMGTSLGALAMLHAYCRYPGSFDALFLQSGSFFVPSLDSQERHFGHYRRITRFTAAVHGGGPEGGGPAGAGPAGSESERGDGLPLRPVPVVLTCGAIEENAANNRLMAAALAGHGYPAALHEGADAHNYTAWRDAFDPHLTRLLQQVTP